MIVAICTLVDRGKKTLRWFYAFLTSLGIHILVVAVIFATVLMTKQSKEGKQ